MSPGLSYFPPEEFERRLAEVRTLLDAQGLRGCVLTSPENVYYLTGLDHQGYFASEALVVALEGSPALITRAMEEATVRDQVPWVRHVTYSDGVAPLPPPRPDSPDNLLFARPQKGGYVAGLEPWSTSLGVPVAGEERVGPHPAPAHAICSALREMDLSGDGTRVGIEKTSFFMSVSVYEKVLSELPKLDWHDCSGLVEKCRVVQSALELQCTRKAARISDAMMLAAIAEAGPGVLKQDVMAALYGAMFRRGGTYPGFVPLVRSTFTLKHEHGTWHPGKLRRRDILFLEMAGCSRRYHAPLGRLVFIGSAPQRSQKANAVCREAIEQAQEHIGPGVKARDVYKAWQACLDKAGLAHYTRHHCGYSVGIGFPPSWSGSGVPVGLRHDSDLELREGMVFHLMSWLLRTGRGDAFLSDTVVVTADSCELLTGVPRNVLVR